MMADTQKAETQRECPACALPIDREADVCPYCGYDLPKQKNSLKLAALIMALLLIWPLIELLQRLFG
jgi:predicted nucleic acid-binding Zn ribbon protein